jgi:hypothetical protein
MYAYKNLEKLVKMYACYSGHEQKNWVGDNKYFKWMKDKWELT